MASFSFLAPFPLTCATLPSSFSCLAGTAATLCCCGRWRTMRPSAYSARACMSLHSICKSSFGLLAAVSAGSCWRKSDGLQPTTQLVVTQWLHVNEPVNLLEMGQQVRGDQSIANCRVGCCGQHCLHFGLHPVSLLLGQRHQHNLDPFDQVD
jgi:hypothetical protein